MSRWIDGPLLGLDLETDSPDPFVALPVSYGMALRRGQQFSIQGALVNPGVEIPEDATAIHGITTERAREEGRPLGEAMEFVKSKLIWAADEGIPVVTMNGSFDLTIVDRLADLSGWSGNVVDVFVVDKACYKYRKGSRRLNRALIDYYGVEIPEALGKAHEAAPDAVAAVLVFLAMCKRYEWLPKRSPESLHKSQIHWYRGQQSNLSDHFVEQGKEPIPEYEWDWPIKRKAS